MAASPSAEPVVKVYGQRNAGTNYLCQLLAANWDARLLRGVVPRRYLRVFGRAELQRDLYFRLTFRRNLGWKHAVAPSPDVLHALPAARNTRFVTLSKNPYAWLLSMHRRPYHYRRTASSFVDFLSAPWRTVGRENHSGQYQNPMALWNDKNRSYLELARHAWCVNLRYEDLLADPACTLAGAADKLGIAFTHGTFTNIAKSTKNDGKVFADYRAYYLQERWKSKFDARTLAMVNSYLDSDVARGFGYAILEAG